MTPALLLLLLLAQAVGRRPGRGLLLACAVLSSGCASLPPPPERGAPLRYTPPGATGPVEAEPPHSLASSRPSPPEPEEPQRLHRRRPLRHTMTRAGPGRAAAEVESTAEETRQAVLAAVGEVKATRNAVAATLARLASRPPGPGNRGLNGINGVFLPHLAYGSGQLPWIDGALGGVTTLTEAASEVGDSGLELALLRMSGPRLQAALSGTLLLAGWVDFLQLADGVLRQGPAYGVETLFMDVRRVQGLVEPTLSALASGEPERIEAAAIALPGVMDQLTGEFQALREGARGAMERANRAIEIAQLVEMLTMVSAMKLTLPRVPPSAPATLGVGLVMGSNGVMVGTRVVVSAEWVERMRRLVQAGVLSAPAVGAAIRIHAGGMLMAQGDGDLPKGVREALGEGPEVRGMRVTGRAGAGMSEAPKHHVLPDEQREWFEKRGFTGDMDIDEFCVPLERATHEAIHGGGDWRLGRLWPGEWNRMIMKVLRDAEARAGRRLTRNEILELVGKRMKDYDLPMKFTRGRRRR
ncbi:MAG TPA: DUF2380 domain-containing protein [Myxococcaceae bacterium]|jgi:hypothetical protein